MPLDRVEAIPFDIATRVRSSRVLDLVQIRAGTLAVEQRAEDLEESFVKASRCCGRSRSDWT